LRAGDLEKTPRRGRRDAEILRESFEPTTRALISSHSGEAVGYALFYTTFSSFECRAGLAQDST